MQQRNKCVALCVTRITMRNLNEKEVTDIKNFWKTRKPNLSDNSVKSG